METLIHAPFVIPGRAKREPGIHNHDRKVWIPDSRSAASGMTSWVAHRRIVTSEPADTFSVVIPGRALKREPGIHNHDRKVWIPDSGYAASGMTSWITHRRIVTASMPTHPRSSFRACVARALLGSLIGPWASLASYPFELSPVLATSAFTRPNSQKIEFSCCRDPLPQPSVDADPPLSESTSAGGKRYGC